MKVLAIDINGEEIELDDVTFTDALISGTAVNGELKGKRAHVPWHTTSIVFELD